MAVARGVFREGFWGSNPPPLFGKNVQFSRGFKKKIPKPLLNFPIHTKKFKTPPSKNFWIRPWQWRNKDLRRLGPNQKFAPP